MDTATFINSLRRSFSIRGQCKLIRSDRGTNFVGAPNDNLKFNSVTDSFENTCRWEFNPPHAPHFGGVWERKVGQIKRSLDAALLKSPHLLTLNEFKTLIFEAAAIVNATPLWQASNDPNDTLPLFPSMLLTLKTPTVESSCFSDDDVLSYGKKRWRKVQILADHFWKEWRNSYLQTLLERQKWYLKKSLLK